MSKTHPVRRATLAEQVEDALRLDIITGVLKPGERLRALDIATRYGVSPTPFREALQRLASEGFVESDPLVGAYVARVSVEELRDIYEVRLLVETQALFQSMQRADRQWVEGLRDKMTALREATVASRAAPEDPATTLRWTAAHRAFHRALIENCKSAWLMRFVLTLYDHSERYRVLSRQQIEPSRDALVEHEQIFEATTRLDAFEAVDRLRDHMRLTAMELGQAAPIPPSGEGASDEATKD